jgi:adenine-specific DNA-methyltransferase
MKYMGSKRYMLKNGFGEAIKAAASDSERIVDLFAGSAAVSWYAAETFEQPVLAVDLQSYSAVLARAVIGRTYPLNLGRIEEEWLAPTLRSAERCRQWGPAERFDEPQSKTRVREGRHFCARERGGPIFSAYGAHYFSPRQALLIDRGLLRLPEREPNRSACRAALIAAAAYCAAAPGHTAQPFQPTASALPYIRESWRRDPLAYARAWLKSTSKRYAKTKGVAKVADANQIAEGLRATDLVIVDPPYSAVQYSRFYHVLEEIASVGEREPHQISGAGRYPPLEERPSSDYSMISRSRDALEDLLETLSEAGCKAIITFPNERCSNGLSGAQIARIARDQFEVKTKSVRGSFSTLGGNNTIRAARHKSRELIISLSPK